MKAKHLPLLLILAVALLGMIAGLGAGLLRRPAAPDLEALGGRPNVVVVMGCTLRKDQLTPYGGPQATSPYLAELAAQGVRFDDLVAAAPWTKASSVALFTGHDALSVGMIEPGRGQNKRVLDASVLTLEERLQAAGYETLGLTANPNLNAGFGMAQGFDRYEDTALEGFRKANKIHGTEAVDRVLAMLRDRQAPDAPFYARLVLIDAHYPIVVSGEELARFEAPGLDPKLQRYRAGVRRFDDALRRLDEGLAALGYDEENTVLVVVTDHGEGLSTPEHHRDQHGKVLYRTLVEVPWILRGPGLARGHVVRGLSAHLDLSPTLLGLVGLPHDDLPGLDLSPQLRGSDAPSPRQRAFSDTWYYGVNRAAVFTPERQCQRDWGSVDVRGDQFRDGCFDRRADPDFTRPFADEALQAELDAWRAEQTAAYEAFLGTADATVDEATRGQLEALGYVE